MKTSPSLSSIPILLIREFDPDLLINAVTIKNTLSAFEEVLPNLRPSCMLSDIASVKTGLPEFYAKCGHPFVSTHPMFGPTFANLNDLSQNYTVIIKESDPFGKAFFREVYGSLRLNIYDYTFEEHDETIAYCCLPRSGHQIWSEIQG